MPADYQSTARALALPLSPASSRSNSFDARNPPSSTRPAWRQHTSTRSIRSRHSLSSNTRSTIDSLVAQASKLSRRALTTFSKLTPFQKFFVVGSLCSMVTFTILFLVFNERIFGWLEPFAKRWKGLRGGWTILWALTFLTAFPPVIGYSTCGTIAGFVYGVWEGWLIYATATILGSTCSFLVSRTILSKYVHRLVASDKRWAALTLTLKHDGLKLICMIRLCPLPYSLSNGAMSTFPTVHPLMYMLATTLVSPKLLIHVFIGSRLGAIAESGEQMPLGTKIINWLSILIGGVIGATVGYYIYQRTMARARQLEDEERSAIRARANSSSPNHPRRSNSTTANTISNDTPDFPAFADLDNDSDASDVEAAINTLARDELSYHDEHGDGDGDIGGRGKAGNGARYRDEFTDGEDSDVFGDGDGDEEEVIGLHRHQGR